MKIRKLILSNLIMFFLLVSYIYAAAPTHSTPYIGAHAKDDETGLVGEWRLNGNADDSSGQGNDGTITGANSTFEGRVGQAYSFDGVDDGILLTDDTSLMPTNFITIESWIKLSKDDQTSKIVSHRDGAINKYFLMLIDNGANSYLRLNINGNDCNADDAPELLIADGWHYAVGSYDGTDSKIYLDGIEVETCSLTTTISTSDNVITIGCRDSTSSNTCDSEYFNGTIDEVRIYNRSLSAKEIGEHYAFNNTKTNQDLGGSANNSADTDSDNIVFNYKWYKNDVLNATRWIDDSSLILYMPFDYNQTANNITYDYALSNDGTIYGDKTWNSTGKVGGAYEFDGSGDYIEVTPSASLTTDLDYITISAWVNIKGVCPDNGNWCSVVDYDDDDGYELGVDATSMRLNARIDSTAIWGACTGTATYNYGEWHHVAATFNGSHANCYWDGVITVSSPREGVLNATAGKNLRIGQMRDNAFWDFNGTIDEVKIYNRSLSAVEIQQLYWATVSGFAVMNSSQTTKGDNWTIEMTPYDDTGKGTPLNSSQITIQNTAPVYGTPILNATDNPLNRTTANLTWWNTSQSDNDGDELFLSSLWYENNQSLPVLYMNFNVNESDSGVRDYSDFNNNGTNYGAVWNRTGGMNGSGAYGFDGVGGGIRASNTLFLNNTFSLGLWVKPVATIAGFVRLTSTWAGANDYLGLAHYSGNLAYYFFYNNNTATGWKFTGVPIPLNNWSYIVLVSNNNGFSIYVDGDVIYDEINRGLVVPNEPFSVGEDGGGTSVFNGTIDEVKIYNRSLSANQVYADYINGLNKFPSKTLVSDETTKNKRYRSMVIVSDGTDETLVNTTEITIQNTAPTAPSVVLNSTFGTNKTTENLTVYISGGIDADGDNITNITDWRKDSKSIAVLNMPFDSNNSAGTGKTKDYSTFDNNGTLENLTRGAGGVSTPPEHDNGKIGKGLRFTAVGEGYNGTQWNSGGGYITVPYTQSLNLSDFTLAAWINPAPCKYAGGAIIRQDSNYMLDFVECNSTHVRPSLRRVNGSWSNVYYSPTFLPVGNWYHIVGTASYNGSHTNLSLYIDGEIDGSASHGGKILSTNGPLRIGARSDLYEFFNGTIDELQIYNFTLTSEQINAMYQSGLDNHSVETIVWQETSKEDVWSVAVTPNDGLEDGTSKNSSSITIQNSCGCQGLNLDWEIYMSDNCNITSNCNLGTGKLSFIDSGYINCNATINTSDLGDPGANGILYINSGCRINVN